MRSPCGIGATYLHTQRVPCPFGHCNSCMQPCTQCRQILKEIIDKKAGMGDIMKNSFFAMTEAVYVAGDNVKHTIRDNVETATVKVNGGLDNVAGVKIPRFEAEVIPGESKMDLTGAHEGCKERVRV